VVHSDPFVVVEEAALAREREREGLGARAAKEARPPGLARFRVVDLEPLGR
jgi:hypothetical protein